MERLIETILAWRMHPIESPKESELRSRIVERITQLETAEREALVLKRIGTSFKTHQSVGPSVIHASHSIRGALHLMMVRVWLRQNQVLVPIATAQERPGRHNIPIHGHMEADSNVATWEVWETCYRALIPLQVGHHKLGYLELFANREQESFLMERDLHLTIGEQLALVLDSALMFESTESQATTDPLTGLCNHRTLQEFLADQCADIKRHRHKVGVVMVDVDHFRQFNETYGHDAGDEVLINVAKALHRAVGERGLAARYGGEEFTLVLPDADPQLTDIVAQSALDHIRKVVFAAPDGTAKQITASMGYSTGPVNGNTPERLLKVADLALYASKHNGRNQVSGPESIPLNQLRAA